MNKFFISTLFLLCFCVFSPAQETATKPVEALTDGVTTPLRILAKPQARYTDMARINNEEGNVTLKITFLASGEIGEISVVSGLAYGLTEQAIAAAKNIKFEPPKKNGQAYSITKTVLYSFIIVIPEDEKEIIKTKAQILEQPEAEYPAGENFKNMRGFVRLSVTLTSFGEVRAQVIYSNLPKEFEDKAREAASRIKYEPAVLKNKVKATVVREIEYEFKPEN